MKRRTILGGLGLAALAMPTAAALAHAGYEIPRRLSTDPSDPGYVAWKSACDRGILFDVYLDGIAADDCDLADVDMGVVRRKWLDENGEDVLLTAMGESRSSPKYRDAPAALAMKTVWGKVEIRISGRSPSESFPE